MATQVGIPITSTISGGGLLTTYKAVQFHLHWGKDGGLGSEHTIDGEQYPMEVNDHQKQPTFYSNASLPPISLAQLIPPEQNLTSYYRYRGSLTTPGCTEAVVWTVFENPIPLSMEQLRAFSKVQFRDSKLMVNNFRPIQPLNGRQVFRSGSAMLLVSSTLLAAALAMALGLSQLN
ncbi:hypothetical protein GOODEAATRI_013738 [Goodea atripinnis]|uniref:Carbonic anhydrase 4 n=1 Tax=Goodea atripinnis TaxID=208336 RepID=A0ABV0NK20_9TELE